MNSTGSPFESPPPSSPPNRHIKSKVRVLKKKVDGDIRHSMSTLSARVGSRSLLFFSSLLGQRSPPETDESQGAVLKHCAADAVTTCQNSYFRSAAKMFGVFCYTSDGERWSHRVQKRSPAGRAPRASSRSGALGIVLLCSF